MQEKKLIYDLALPLVKAQGLEIWGLDVSGIPPKKVCLYVDTPIMDQTDQSALANSEKPDLPNQSASIDQCEEISRQLGLALDVEDIMPEHWTLEVSTPGLERKFFMLDQMRPYRGDIIEAALKNPIICGITPSKLIRGKLLEIGDDYFDLEPCQIGAEGEILPSKDPVCRIPWDQCRLVKRLYIFKAPQKPGKNQAKRKRSK